MLKLSVQIIMLFQNSPELLPRRDMLELLMHIIGTSGGRIRQLAAKALLDTSMCGSALEGCAAAEQDEIDVLLKGLQCPGMTVRETCLQVKLLSTVNPGRGGEGDRVLHGRTSSYYTG